MAASGSVAVGIHSATGGQVDRLERMADLVLPRFGYTDEARVVFADRGGVWATLSILRGNDDAVFDPSELSLLTEIAPALTRGIRTGLLSQVASREAAQPTGPAVLIIDAAGRVVQSSPGAQERLGQLATPGTDPLSYIQALIRGARRFASGALDRMPRVRTRTPDGVWLVLHAAPLGGIGDRAGDVVVTIEEARPQEVVDIVAAAFTLTLREREVVGSVLRGADTKEIAASMHVSPYTVQDHLKSIFDKAGVGSPRAGGAGVLRSVSAAGGVGAWGEWVVCGRVSLPSGREPSLVISLPLGGRQCRVPIDGAWERHPGSRGWRGYTRRSTRRLRASR